MGSSYVEFRGNGFEATDGVLEIWLHLLIEEIDKISPLPEWMQELRAEWKLQSTAGFGFGVMLGLDNFLTDESRVAAITEISHRALQHLHSYGVFISSAQLNAMYTDPAPVIYSTDVPVRVYVRVGEYFIKLLKQELKADENDARIFSL